MPELAEVERARALIHERCLGKTIQFVHAEEDKILFVGVDHETFINRTSGCKVTDTGRHGKYFFVRLNGNDGPTIVMHFGMTGDIKFKDMADEPIRIERFNLGTDWPPKYTKFWMIFSGADPGDEVSMAFTDPRRLGRVRLVDNDPTVQPPLSELGFDPILSPPTLEIFMELARKRKVPVKALLLDQKFSAGVGNWIADEVLFQSRIHPAQYAHTLSDAQLATMLERMVYICKTAVKCKGDMRNFPKEWLFHYRWGKGKNVNQLPDGRKIIHDTVGGRTTAIVPDVQKLPGKVAVAKVAAVKGSKKGKKTATGVKEEKKEGFSEAARADKDGPAVALVRRSARTRMRVSYYE